MFPLSVGVVCFVSQEIIVVVEAFLTEKLLKF
jgi:hypothetical protein